MNNEFTINGKEYKAKGFTYNFMCNMEEQGISLDDIDKKPMTLSRLYLAYCGNITPQQAGEEIESHVVNGGDMSDLFVALGEAVDKSGFFQAIARQNQPEAEEPKKSEKEKKRPVIV